MSGGGEPTYFDGLKMSRKQKTFMLLLITGTFLEQMDLYLFAMLAPALMKIWNLTVGQVGQIHGAFAVGAVLGGLFFGWLADKKGRKLAMGTAILVGGFGAVCAAVAPSYSFLIMARVLCGFGITGGLVIEPNFLVEMVPSDTRQKWQGILGLIALTGIPLSAFIAKTMLGLNLENWRYVAAIPSIGLVIGVLFILLVHESPRWLVINGRAEEGKRVFKEITGQELNIDPDFQCIVEKVSYGEAFRILFSKTYAKRTVLFFTIFMVLYNAGFMFMQWLPTLLTKEGMEMAQAMQYQQWVTLALLAGPLYIILFGDKGGRKYPYAIALSFIALGLLGISLAGTVNTSLLTASVLLVGAFYICNQGFSSVYASECFPTRVRVIIFSIFLVSQRCVNIITNSVIAPKLYKSAGFSGYFLALTAVYIAVIILILWIGPKTAGKSLEEITQGV